ncbi:hypothetical protein [Hyalangium rubrum]|uniref:Plasmid stabilization protein n=1 Tax=Hyalangium rubrum TaxID=3103134 RepID=A0ABU5HIA8_9BACT|nr:hypothetical protein [Hyalangium sp. s54d21]MDY7231820.1 hypothetical protein [Hyalangium sp. s54d21]
MPPRGVKSPKRQRQYEHIKESTLARGASEGRAEELASRTVNKQRRKAGETKKAPRRATAGKTSRRKTGTTSSRGISSARGKTSARGTTRARGKSSSSRKSPSRSRS